MVQEVKLLKYCHADSLGVGDVQIRRWTVQYIPRNMHTVFALLCFAVVIHWLIFPYPSGLLHWHCGNLTIAPVPAKQPWWIWINTSCEFIMNDCITTTKQSTTKPCAYFLGYTVSSLEQVIACRLISTKPFLEPLLAYLNRCWPQESVDEILSVSMMTIFRPWCINSLWCSDTIWIWWHI